MITALFAAIVAFGTIGFLLGYVLVRGGHVVPVAAPPTSGQRPPEPGDALVHDEMKADVLFITAADGIARLDLVVTDGPARGFPFDLPLHVPADAGWPCAALMTMRRWANDGTSVDLEILEHDHRPLVRISDGETSLRLDPVHETHTLGE